MFTVSECMVAWTPMNWPVGGFDQTRGKIEVGPWPDRSGWSKPYAQSVGACFHATRGNVLQMFLDFHTAVVRDGIDPQIAHGEFLKIAEYRSHISPDINGADRE